MISITTQGYINNSHHIRRVHLQYSYTFDTVLVSTWRRWHTSHSPYRWDNNPQVRSCCSYTSPGPYRGGAYRSRRHGYRHTRCRGRSQG